ncbi:hypothetical protein PAPYR_7624 [Paratrimastix pyriformis]|uniref:Uncharacterized protein n=1 Tax=Paratrimastix pyriformis TaxID=342808 RepID=A0ABQ8UCH4_9EUKA|nr:hypothetical protein PAPYR_7624 [Paratrimastix pyriformis]
MFELLSTTSIEACIGEAETCLRALAGPHAAAVGAHVTIGDLLDLMSLLRRLEIVTYRTRKGRVPSPAALLLDLLAASDLSKERYLTFQAFIEGPFASSSTCFLMLTRSFLPDRALEAACGAASAGALRALWDRLGAVRTVSLIFEQGAAPAPTQQTSREHNLETHAPQHTDERPLPVPVPIYPAVPPTAAIRGGVSGPLPIIFTGARTALSHATSGRPEAPPPGPISHAPVSTVVPTAASPIPAPPAPPPVHSPTPPPTATAHLAPHAPPAPAPTSPADPRINPDGLPPNDPPRSTAAPSPLAATAVRLPPSIRIRIRTNDDPPSPRVTPSAFPQASSIAAVAATASTALDWRSVLEHQALSSSSSAHAAPTPAPHGMHPPGPVGVDHPASHGKRPWGTRR